MNFAPVGAAARQTLRIGVAWLLLTNTAHAAEGNWSALAQNLGPWLFASVALVLVAVLSWRLGFGFGRRQARQEFRSKGAAAAPDSISPTAVRGAASRKQPMQPDHDDAAAFTYAISHDLRAPLRVVDGFARILKEDYGRQLDRIGNDHLDRLLGAAARMNSMIEGMLSVARLSAQAVNRKRISLSQIALDIIGELQSLHADRQVTVQIAPDLVAEGDPVLLRQLLENLLSNAWKYTARTERARIQLRMSEKNGQQVFEVCDNGTGFDMGSAKRLFGMFHRLHSQSAFPGTGLGLASARRIVKLHGGHIWAEAEPGKGARFYFTLPG